MNKIINKDIYKKILKFLKKFKHFIYMGLPFLVMDLLTRFFDKNIDFFSITEPVPTLFTLIWIFLFIGLSISFKDKIGKKLYIFFIAFSIFIYLVNNIYYNITDTFFDFSLLGMAAEGSSYIFDAIKQAKLWLYLSLILIIILSIVAVKYYPKRTKNDPKLLVKTTVVFVFLHLLIPLLLGPANSDLSWNTWRNVKNIYISFNDNNKSMRVAGLYEYMVRNFYITFLKEEEVSDDSEKDFLNDVFLEEETHKNDYTGMFEGKNLILLQMEGIDNWLVTEEIMPNLYSLTNNAINFNNHYSYYNGGGSTFNSEFAVNTGYITPISYTRNAYTFNKNKFNYSLANLFKTKDYQINAFHMNSAEYYSRKINYKNWGYDDYYGLKDLDYYENEEYTLDRELINNPIFYEKMFQTNSNFVNYIITYSNHIPFSTDKGVCKLLVELDQEESGSEEKAILSEEECIMRQAKETDYMIGLLIQALKDNNLLDNTIIVAYADHYLYTVSDDNILARHKDTSNNLVNHTPLLIWSNNLKRVDVNKVTSQLNILPTILNLFGLEYHPSYYIAEDALDPNYEGIAFFSDYSWYDGEVYVDSGIVTNNKKIDPKKLEEKNNYINYIIKKNDLVLKYNHFKDIKDPKKISSDQNE